MASPGDPHKRDRLILPGFRSRRSFIKAAGLAAAGIVAGETLAACGAPATAPTPMLAALTPPGIPTSQAPAPTAATSAAPTAEAAGAMRFPAGFLWGVATSAYQIEGAAQEDGRGESVWDRFSHTPGRTRNRDTGDVACDHYHRYEQDLDLMQELGFQTYRFSIAWPRVLPTGAGPVNQKGLDFYRRLVEGLLKRDIRPMATLFHWDTPQALQDQGGWESRDTAHRFAEYADVLFRALGDVVPAWLSLNEPKTVVMVGYIYGAHAPGLRDSARAYQALHHMLLGHGLAVQAFRAAVSGKEIGIALNLSPVYSTDKDRAAQEAIRLQDGYENRLYLDPILRGAYPEDMIAALRAIAPSKAVQAGDLEAIGAPIDILGVNYYNPTYVRAGPEVVPGPQPYSAASWQQIYPEGLYDTLVRLKRDYGDIPIYITENGAPFVDKIGADGQVDDPQRRKVLHDHFAAAHRAITAGVNLRGYHVWSLMDNFEWSEGYSQRWGIVYVDFKTQRRLPKASAHWYQQVIAANRVDAEP
jgi:beta-glucosidase